MTTTNYIIHLIIAAILIVGAYQFYFFTQRHVLFKVKEFSSPIDEKIPFMPWWGWLYSFIYYPAILYLVLLCQDSQQFIMMAFAFIILLFLQMLCFTLYPVKTPKHWRNINQGKTWSEKFLLFVQKFDDSSNCFPSMHVSVATLTALLALSALGPVVYVFPVLIALSCLFTKQHYILDLPAGALLGWLVFQVYQVLICS